MNLIYLIALLENKSVPQVLFESLEFNEGLKDWAVNELKLAGLYEKGSDYDGMIGKAVEEIIDVFSKQGHSGGSASVIIEILEKLLRYIPLTPCDHKDYIDHANENGGKSLFQCKRCFHMFSEDGGNTWHDVGEKTEEYGWKSGLIVEDFDGNIIHACLYVHNDPIKEVKSLIEELKNDKSHGISEIIKSNNYTVRVMNPEEFKQFSSDFISKCENE